ncbi:PD-(D/E)XK nuclease family protein [Anaerovoracaceae bacterium 41-7]
MAKRVKDVRLIELEEAGIKPYSISKLNAIDGCLLEAYFTYKEHNRGRNSIYGVMGAKIHDVLEEIYNDTATKEDLLPALKKELVDADLIGVDFPKDMKGGTAIKDNWIADMESFCKSFEKMKGDFSTEEFLILKVSDSRYLIGYADLIQIVDEENKVIDIYDFKTSAKFKKDDLKHHGRQLIVYGLAKAQEGYEIRRLAWIMLKYVKVQFDGYKRVNSKSKSKITKVIQRCKFAKEMCPVVEKMLYDAGCDELDVEIMIANFLEENSLSVLPDEIRNQITVEQYIEEYPFSEELQQEALDYINDRADKFEELWDKPMEQWVPVEINRSQEFYCNNLCKHRDSCHELQRYNLLVTLEETDDEDLF